MAGFPGLVPIPHSVFSPKVRSDLTLRWKIIDSEDQQVLQMFQHGGENIWIPRDYGVNVCASTAPPYEHGAVMREDIDPIELRDYQEPWVADICRQFQDHHDVIAKAGVGKGKTVMSLEVARRMGLVPLILVDQEFLKNQWIERAMEFYATDEDDIGIIQGPTCDYENKTVVIGMIQSLYQKQYPAEVYEHFGLVILDEVHTVGAPQFSKVLSQFGARYRLGVSATPNRPDALNKVLRAHLGPVRVELESEHEASQVRIIEYDDNPASWYATITKKEGRFITEVSEDTDRNLMIAEVIHRMWKKGRHMLIIGGRIMQLEGLIEMVVAMGVDRDDCGLVTGSESVWRYNKDPNPNLPPEGWDGKVLYTPVKLGVSSKTVRKTELELRKNTKQLIFSTYGMFMKGVDVPRLDSGIDVTPRSRSQQVHGRILRTQPGKATPIWVTIRDRVNYRCEFQLMNRLAEYAENNAEVYLWRPSQGQMQKQDVPDLRRRLRTRVARLQEAKILTRRDGRNIVLIPGTGQQLNAARSKPIVKRIRRRRARSSGDSD